MCIALVEVHVCVHSPGPYTQMFVCLAMVHIHVCVCVALVEVHVLCATLFFVAGKVYSFCTLEKSLFFFC